MPTAPKRPCASQPCPELVTSGRCPKHSQSYDQTRRPEWVARFYASTAWKKLRRMKRIANPLCEDCDEQGRIIETQAVDHIVPLMQRPDLGLVWENLRSLCHPCHDAKTRRGA